jgi:hypothetical protein
MSNEKQTSDKKQGHAPLAGVRGRALMISFLPEPFKRMAIKNEEINSKIKASYNRLKKRVGKVEADELMIQFKNDAFAGLEVNHEYMIRKMDSHGL